VIHAFSAEAVAGTWMAGSSPAMTAPDMNSKSATVHPDLSCTALGESRS
jgi:hypothetical protein